MNMLAVKYNLGDVVYYASSHITNKKHPCPDCMGSRVWMAVSPAGQEYSFGCPRCSARYQGDKNASLNYSYYEPLVEKRTIGSVQTNTADENPVRYMCVETGVGSGTVYNQSMLFPDEDSALLAATIQAKQRNAETKWIVEQYKGTLELSDYQLSDARDKGAVKAAEERFERVRYFAEDILQASNMDEVKEIHEKHFGESK